MIKVMKATMGNKSARGELVKLVRRLLQKAQERCSCGSNSNGHSNRSSIHNNCKNNINISISNDNNNNSNNNNVELSFFVRFWIKYCRNKFLDNELKLNLFFIEV